MAAVAVAVLAAAGTQAQAAGNGWPQSPSARAGCDVRPSPSLCKLHFWVDRTHAEEARRSMARTRYWFSAERRPEQNPWTARRLAWRTRAQRIAKIPIRPWSAAWFSDIMCIHGHEGAWTDETGNGYNGGLQMDHSFETTYGPEFYARMGDAGHWPPLDQIIAAWRAYQTRGFGPWPNTRLDCGV